MKWLDRWAMRRIRKHGTNAPDWQDGIEYAAARLSDDIGRLAAPLAKGSAEIVSQLAVIARTLKLQGPFAWRPVTESPGMLQEARCCGCQRTHPTLQMVAATNVASGEGYLYCTRCSELSTVQEAWLRNIPRGIHAL